MEHRRTRPYVHVEIQTFEQYMKRRLETLEPTRELIKAVVDGFCIDDTRKVCLVPLQNDCVYRIDVLICKKTEHGEIRCWIPWTVELLRDSTVERFQDYRRARKTWQSLIDPKNFKVYSNFLREQKVSPRNREALLRDKVFQEHLSRVKPCLKQPRV